MTGVFRTLLGAIMVISSAGAAQSANHSDLVNLFHDWRAFEVPPTLDGAPDYTAATFAKRHAKLAEYQQRLKAMDISDWSHAEKADWHILRAEMNGFDFNHRVLKPWVRDPAFYKSVWTARSDVPAHED